MRLLVLLSHVSLVASGPDGKNSSIPAVVWSVAASMEMEALRAYRLAEKQHRDEGFAAEMRGLIEEMHSRWTTQHEGGSAMSRKLSSIAPCEWKSTAEQCRLSGDFMDTLVMPEALAAVFRALEKQELCEQVSFDNACHKAIDCHWTGTKCEAHLSDVLLQLLGEVFDVTRCGPMGLMVKNVAPCLTAESSKALCEEAGKGCIWSTASRIECDDDVTQCSDCSEHMTGCGIGDLVHSLCPDSELGLTELSEQCTTQAMKEMTEMDEMPAEDLTTVIMNLMVKCLGETCKPLGELMGMIMEPSMKCQKFGKEQTCRGDKLCSWDSNQNQCTSDMNQMLPDECPYKAMQMHAKNCEVQTAQDICKSDTKCQWKVSKDCAEMSGLPVTRRACGLDDKFMMDTITTAGHPAKVAVLDLLNKEAENCIPKETAEQCTATVKVSSDSQIDDINKRMAEVNLQEQKFENGEPVGEDSLESKAGGPASDAKEIADISVSTSLLLALLYTSITYSTF